MVFPLNVLVLEALQLKRKGLAVEEGRGGAQIGVSIRLFTKDGDRVGLLLELSRQQQREEPAAENSDSLSLLRAEDAAEL